MTQEKKTEQTPEDANGNGDLANVMARFLGFNLSEKEIGNLLTHFKICNKLRKVKIDENLKEIMTKRHPDEYSDNDNVFFKRYAGKEVLVFKYANDINDNDWFILEDNNYPIYEDCFSNVP